MGRAPRPTASQQVPLLLLLVLLSYLGSLAFCAAGMAMDTPAVGDVSSATVGAPVICSAGGGDCLLSWTAPISLVKTSYAIALLSVSGSLWLLLEGTASLGPIRHALDPPSGIRLHALLQVFRI